MMDFSMTYGGISWLPMMPIFGYFTGFFDSSNQVYNQVYGGIPPKNPTFKTDGMSIYIRLRARVNYIYN